MIKLQIIGHLGKDCVVNNVSGKNVINFSVAHAEKFKDAQGVQRDKTIWVECAYWTDRTAVAPYLKKGTLVFAEGQPDTKNYTSKDGTPVTALTLRVSSVQLLGGRADGQGGDTGGSNYQNNQSAYSQPSYNQTPQNQTSYNQTPANQPNSQTPVPSSDITEPSDDLPF